jgi:hypothetical protein
MADARRQHKKKACSDAVLFFCVYSDPPLKKPPPLNEPPAILNADLRSDLLYFIHGCHRIVSTVEKIKVVIAVGLPKVCWFYRKIDQEPACLQTRDDSLSLWQRLLRVKFLWCIPINSNYVLTAYKRDAYIQVVVEKIETSGRGEKAWQAGRYCRTASVTIGRHFYSYMYGTFSKAEDGGATVILSNPFKTRSRALIEALKFNCGCSIFFLDHANTGDNGVTYCDKIPFYGWLVGW